MIRTWLIIVLALAAGAALAYFLRADSGYVLMNLHGWTVETSVLALAAAVLLGLPLTLYTLRAILGVVRLPATLLRIHARRRSDRARLGFESGLLHLQEGQWKRAEIELVRRAADHGAPHLNYLAAARAAQRLGASDRSDRYLQLAADQSPTQVLASQLARAELQIERGDHRGAHDTLIELRQANPQHAYVVHLLAECHAALGQWAELHGLLSATEKLSHPDLERRSTLLAMALRHRMLEAIAQAHLDTLKSLWQRAAAPLRQDADLRRTYVRGLLALNAHAEAGALITTTLARNWDAELVEIYGALQTTDPLGQLATIEQWLTQYGERPELLVTAGRACRANQLWGKARSYLEAVIRQQPSPLAYLELARLAEQTQNTDEATRLLRQGLELAAR